MNCVELRESLAENESGSTPEQRAHLHSCRTCTALLADLDLIASEAVELRAAHEPSPQVWKNIEAALRQEGLIRPQTAGRSLLPSFFASPWAMVRWMVPAAAVLLLAIGIYVRPHAPRPIISYNAPVASASLADPEVAGLNDDDLLQEVDQQAPALKEQYTENLRRVNQYIQDEKGIVASNPNDEEARRELMEAYQEKAMLFELALDRSLP
jgi:hypothetical protein